MNRNLLVKHYLSVGNSGVLMLLLGLCFLAGIISGHFLAVRCQPADLGQLTFFAESIGESLQNCTLRSLPLPVICLSYYFYPVLAFLLGCSAWCLCVIPAIAVYQGFSVSFAVSAFLYAAQKHGLMLGFCLFGLRSLFVLPCFFFLGCHSMLKYCKKTGLDESGREHFCDALIRLAGCIALLSFGALLENVLLIRVLSAVYLIP